MRDFGKAIKYYRNKCSMTQSELAEKLSVSNQTVSKWETGVNSPAADVIADICNILGVSLADFFAYAESGTENGDISTQTSNGPTTPAPSVGEAVVNTFGATPAEAAVQTSAVMATPGKIRTRLGKDLPFFITAIVLGIVILLSLLFSILSGRTYSAEQIYERVNPSVVCIYVNRSNGDKVSGSGFYIDGNGKAVTNYHVIEKAKSIYIYNYKGQRYDVTEVVSVDVDKDIAILQTEARRTPSVKIGNSDRVKTGEKVYAIGYPQSFVLGNVDSTFTEGTVSKSSYSVNGVNYIQSTVNITNGNSGGVLINSRAEVIGITTAGLDLNDIDYMNFSVPINNVRTVKYTVNIPVENFATDFKFYTVKYYVGNTLYRSYTVLRNEVLEEIVMPEEDGMAYVGWGKDSISGEDYDFNQPVQGNLNLYLKRKPAYYIISFSANDGTGSQEMDKCRYENKYTLPQCTFEKLSYKFIGWKYNEKVYKPGDKFENTSKISKVNFTATWERTGYFVKYFSASSAETREEINKIDESLTLPDCPFTMVGHTFACWEIDGVTYSAGEKYSNTDNKERVYVYAKWEPISYTLILKNFKGETIFNEQVLYTDVVNNLTVSGNSVGHEHCGWKDGNGNTYPVSLSMLTTVEGDIIELTPIEKPITYSITYLTQGVNTSYQIKYNQSIIKTKYDGEKTRVTTITVQYGSTPDEPTLTDGRNLVFDGWDYYVNGELFTGDILYLTDNKWDQVTAVDRWTSGSYQLKIYKFYYRPQYDPIISVELSGNEEYTLPTGNEDWAKATGCNFICWNVKDDWGDVIGQFESGATISDLMTQLYSTYQGEHIYYIDANYEHCVWTIEFDGNGGEGSMDPIVYEYGNYMYLPQNTFTKEGYVFACWEYNGKTYNAPYRLGKDVLMEGNGTAVFKAVWVEFEEQSEEVT